MSSVIQKVWEYRSVKKSGQNKNVNTKMTIDEGQTTQIKLKSTFKWTYAE